ncbi:PAS domain S-box protein [Halovenus salina]|uniref:histidine kinase n=1 Tax=Halovenus salina TaxID=1510225 RepID=A0ABD5VXH3_9EURY|nr:PAS domain S-box protein [Halovenus salina]
MTNPEEPDRHIDHREPGWYRRVVHQSHDTTAVLDAVGDITYIDPSVESLLGYDPADLMGESGSEYVYSEDAEKVIDAFMSLRNNPGATEQIEVRLREQSGSCRWVEAHIQNLLDDDIVGGILVTMCDVTERRTREAELSATKERMKMALEGANLGVWDWNMVTDDVKRDELLTDMLGYTRDEMGDDLNGWEEVVHPDGKQRHDDALAEHIANETAHYECEYRLQTKTGGWKWVQTMGKVVERDENGKPVRAVGIHQDIDEQKRTKLALREERDLFTAGPAVVFKWHDTECWPIEYVSENVEDVFGYDPEHLQSGGVCFADLIHEADLDRVVQEVTEHRAQGNDQFSPEPYRIHTADDDVRWVMEYTHTLQDEDAPLTGYLIDITERKRRELELQQYKEAVQQSAHAIYITDADGTIEYVNPAFESVTGYTGEEAVGKTPRILQSGEYDDEFYDELWETILSGETWDAEIRDERVDGDEVVLNQTIAPITDDDGTIRKFVAVAQDITDRKTYQEELEAREAKYRRLFEDTRDALMLLDRDGYFDCNETALELFGIESVEAFVEYAPWELSPPTQPDGTDSKAAALEHITEAFDEGESFFEWTHKRVDGTDFPAEVKLSQFQSDGEPALLALVRDITERKAYEQQLEEQRDDLDVLNQVLRHDIRNDLQLITAYAELLEDECDDDEKYIETVLESANHAVELTLQARDMADVMVSDEELQHVTLRNVLEDELTEVQLSFPDATIAADSQLPSVSVQATDMLGSVFRNLLKNAIQHNGKDNPEVHVSAQVEENTVTVRVADNGPGVPDNQKEEVFGKGETGLESSGTGIGLYLVKTLVESYGGNITVEDNDPEGAIFVVELPTAA